MAKPVFEWSAIKRLAVLQERGLDFIDGQLLFDGRPLYTAPSRRGAEMRWLSIGELNGRLCGCVDGTERCHSDHHDEESAPWRRGAI
jgi:uncharacterized DUF497 family protein